MIIKIKPSRTLDARENTHRSIGFILLRDSELRSCVHDRHERVHEALDSVIVVMDGEVPQVLLLDKRLDACGVVRCHERTSS